jgi:hypothetical protein
VVVVVVSPGGGVVVVSVGEQSSPIRTIAHRSHVPGSRHRIRAEPHGTARSTSVAPGSTSANWYASSPGRTRTRTAITPETTASVTWSRKTPSGRTANRPRRRSSGISPATPILALKTSRAFPPTLGSAHGSPIATTANASRSRPVSLRTSSRVASRSTSSETSASSDVRRPRHSATTAPMSFHRAAGRLRTRCPGCTFSGMAAPLAGAA